MTELITSLKIEGFRAFRELSIPTFGKVNLITGKNNTGKTSLLEAIRILVSRGSAEVIREILASREEEVGVSDLKRDVAGASFEAYRSIFTGFPDLTARAVTLSMVATGVLPQPVGSLSMAARQAIRKLDASSQLVGYELLAPDQMVMDDPDGIPALEIRMGDEGPGRVISLYGSRIFTQAMASRPGAPFVEKVRSIDHLYVDPFTSRVTAQLGDLWDEVALTDLQPEILHALQIVAPEIEGISMIGWAQSGTRVRKAIVRSQAFPQPVTLRTFGDGVVRLFGIVLSLCNIRDGILLIDEFENGLHYSVQVAVWKTIFRLARQLNVQVFATSHSWDCVRAFSEAAADSPADGVLTRLTRVGDKVIPATFTESDLKVVTEYDIEVR
jgi:hypothetical protein